MNQRLALRGSQNSRMVFLWLKLSIRKRTKTHHHLQADGSFWDSEIRQLQTSTLAAFSKFLSEIPAIQSKLHRSPSHSFHSILNMYKRKEKNHKSWEREKRWSSRWIEPVEHYYIFFPHYFASPLQQIRVIATEKDCFLFLFLKSARAFFRICLHLFAFVVPVLWRINL